MTGHYYTEGPVWVGGVPGPSKKDPVAALEAVKALHYPAVFEGDITSCAVCRCEGWPCKTRQIIDPAL